MKLKSVMLLISMAYLCLAFNVNAKQRVPKVVPENWVADYDYKVGVKGYLREQYSKAKKKGLVPYIYVYSDLYSHCLRIRSKMKREDMQDAFSGTYIIMLDYYRLRKLYRKDPALSFSTGKLRPIIVPVSEAGGLIANLILPDSYLHHPELINEKAFKRYSIARKWIGSSVPYKVFAKRMKQYFNDQHASDKKVRS